MEPQKNHMFLAKYLHNLSVSDTGMFDYSDVKGTFSQRVADSP